MSTADVEIVELRDFNRPSASTSPIQNQQDVVASEPTAIDVLQSQEFSLPPVDRGKDAWMFLAAAFSMEALVWGFPFAYGVFQDYYSTHEPFAGSKDITIIGTCAMGIMYLSAPLVFAMLQRWPRLQKWSTPVGLTAMCLGLLLSSFASNTAQLIATQGVIYAVGGAFAYSPCILFMDQWFVKRKGLAYGVMWAGTGLAGVVLPILMQWLLASYGHRTALRTWTIVLCLMIGPLLFFVKPRVPITKHYIGKRFDLSWVFTKTFLILQLCNFVEALGFFIPGIYLPSYARDIGADGYQTALTVILVNTASVVGCIVMGGLTDRLHVTTCIALSAAGTTLSIFLVWGFSTSLVPLYVFCTAYGLFAGSFSSTWPGIMRHILKRQESADPLMVFAMLAAGRGIGNVVSGPLSEALKDTSRPIGHSVSAYGSQYGLLIIFTGVTAFLGGMSILARPYRWL